MGNAQSAQENDERRRHVARGRRSMPDQRTRQQNENGGDNRERSEVSEAVASSSGGSRDEGSDARIQLLATSIRSDLKIDCPMVVIDEGRLRRFSHLSRVPHRIANAHPRAYMPSVISVGPYHWGSPSLKAMEVQKRQFLELNLWSKDETTWNAYVKLMAKLEIGVRRYYPDRVNAMDSNAFLSMMLLDGFYILGLLYPLSFVRVQSNDAHDAVDIWHDLLLLENQIPFVIVEHISEQWAQDAGEDGETLLVMIREQAAICIESVLCNLSIPFVIEPSQRPAQFEHLLYLLHTYLRPSKLYNSALEHGDHIPPSRAPNLISMNRYSAGRIAGRLLYKFSIVLLNWAYNFYNRNRHHQIEDSDGTSHCHLHLHRAVQYIESGIKFRVKEGRGHNSNRHSLLDITISNNDVMEIPHLHIDESAYWLFGNLISFEQANASVEKDVTAYVIFMSQLMATADDVGLLVREKIVHNQLGTNQDVSILFASLAREVMFDFDSEYHLSLICDTLQKRYRNPKRWRAVCAHWHCGTLWGTWLGALVAFFLFVCTMIMTVFTIMAYVRLPDHSDKEV